MMIWTMASQMKATPWGKCWTTLIIETDCHLRRVGSSSIPPPCLGTRLLWIMMWLGTATNGRIHLYHLLWQEDTYIYCLYHLTFISISIISTILFTVLNETSRDWENLLLKSNYEIEMNNISGFRASVNLKWISVTKRWRVKRNGVKNLLCWSQPPST